MLKISEHLYVDKKYIIRQIIEDLLKSIAKYLDIKYLTRRDDSYLYVDDKLEGKEQLILVYGSCDSHGKWGEDRREIISEDKSDINKYYTAYNLMQLYL